RHRARVRIGERYLPVLALHHLRIDRVEADDLFLELLDLVLQPHNFRLRHRIAVPVGSLELREIASDALVDPLQAPLHLGLGEVLVPRIDRLELRSVDGDARCTEQIKLAAQPNELAANLTNGLAIVLAEIRDGLEVRRQLPGQPDHLDIALALPLQASARRNPIEVAVDIKLEHHARMVAGSPPVERLNATRRRRSPGSPMAPPIGSGRQPRRLDFPSCFLRSARFPGSPASRSATRSSRSSSTTWA